MPEYIINEASYHNALHTAFSAGVSGSPSYTTDCLVNEVIRCRDCGNARIKYTAKGSLKSASCQWHGRCINPDGYCAWGRRKESAE